MRTSLVPLLVGALLAAGGLVPTAVNAANPSKLWEIVHGECVPNQLRTGKPRPCAVVDLHRGVEPGYAALKDIVGDAQYLLIPTQRISGIESSKILAADAPNYFSLAWRWRSLFERRLPRAVPRDGISLAINSPEGRTQNQLHIHIDCVRSDVREILRRQRADFGPGWRPIAAPLVGHRYHGMRVLSDHLDANPFRLLASRMPRARTRMGDYTLVVVGAEFAHHRRGFVILARRAIGATESGASGEELQDHTCAIAQK
jgi:CDP-diacylglycerol pyrophosphatase